MESACRDAVATQTVHRMCTAIAGSDLLYAPEAHADLLASLAALCTPGHTDVLLTYPTRFTEDL